MSHPCPDCGTQFDLEDRSVTVRVGACPGCHRTFTLLPHGVPVPPGTPEAAAGDADGVIAEIPEEPDDDGAESDPDTPVCGNCGSDLTFRAADEQTIEVYCPKCEETTRFRAEGTAPPAAPAPADDDDGPRRPRREGPWQDRGDRGDRGDRRGPPGPPRRFDDAPRGRGCRRCGGPIDFQPTDDGGREGVCRNCGNRFRLPPREEGDRGGGGYRPRDRYGGGGGRRDFRPRGPPRGRYGGGGGERRRRDD